MLTQRQHDILEYCLQQHHPVRVDDLAVAFKVSSKTIRLELKLIQHIAKEVGCHLSIKPSLGIIVQHKNDRRWTQLLSQINYVDQTHRLSFLMLRALTQTSVSVQKSAGELSVSRQTLTRDLKLMRSHFNLEQNDLTQTTHGFKLTINEGSLREKVTTLWSATLPTHIVHQFLQQFYPDELALMTSWCETFQQQHELEFEANSKHYILMVMTLLAIRSSLHPMVHSSASHCFSNSNRPALLDDDACMRCEALLSAARLVRGQLTMRQELDDIAHELLVDLCQSVHITYHEDDPHILSLLMHLKATCQRLKHHSFIENPLIEDVHVSFSLIYDVTQQCLMNFEKKHHLSFNDHEISYIVMHLGVLVHAAGVIDANLKVAIVCPHGSATSKVLMNRIQSILPNHHLFGPYSISEFEAMRSHTVFDKVITTLSLGLEDEIVVNPMLSLDDQDRIERLIWNATYQKQCSRVLDTYRVTQQEHLTLSMLIKPHQLILEHSVTSWKQAIHMASQPLLSEGRIKSSYVEKMIWAVDHLGPYMVILPSIAFVHAAPDDGVMRNGISCLRLKEPLLFGEKKSVDVRVIIVIASLAKEDMGLIKLIRILEHEDNMQTLFHSNSIDTILAMKG